MLGQFSRFKASNLYYSASIPAVVSSDIAAQFFFEDYTTPAYYVPALTFNELDKASTISLDSTKLIATNTGTVTPKVVRGTRYVINEARVIKYTVTQFATGNDMSVGFSTRSHPLGTRMHLTTEAVTYDYGGNIDSNSVQLAFGMPTWGLGDEIFVAIKAGYLWFRVNTGTWNNSGTADPDAGVGGIALPSSLLNKPLWPSVSFWNLDGIFTVDPYATGHGLATFDTWEPTPAERTLKILSDVFGADLLDNWLADEGIQLSSTNVKKWFSQDGLGTILEWGGGNQPLIDDGSLPSVYMQQYGQIGISNPVGYPTGTQGTTTVMVVRAHANQTYDVLFRYCGNYFGTMGTGSGWAYNPGYGDTRNSGIDPSTSDYDIVVISVDSGTNPAIKIRVNGTLAYSGTVGTRSLSLASDNTRIGSNSGNASLPANWTRWRQVAVVGRGSTDSELEIVEGIVAWKWDLPLPSGHPYEFAAPSLETVSSLGRSWGFIFG